jgi:hypothetical protein
LILRCTLSNTFIITLQTSTGLKGTRKLQFGGTSLASSQGISNSLSALSTAGGPTNPFAAKGRSFGTGNAGGTGNAFIYSSQGQALSSGTSFGNSTANTTLTVLGNSTTTGLLTSAGIGQGSAGGNAVFGPAFSFQVGLPTGGGGGGFGLGSGATNGAISTTGANAIGANKAYGNALANGFGTGSGSGVAVNAGNEQAGGQGGGTSFGQGQFTFDLDDVTTGTFANNGATKAQGGGGAYVGFDPPVPFIFDAFINPFSAATP